jgi:hypothetical protein
MQQKEPDNSYSAWPSNFWMNKRFEKGLVFGFFSLLAVAVTWPTVIHLRDRVLGSYPGDNFQFLWALWFAAHATFDLHTSPFFDPDIYFPFGFSLIRNLGELSPATILLFMPFTHWIGEVATYNLLILISFILTGFATFLLARELGTNRSGSLLAGIATGFCAYRYAHAAGHLSLVSTQWIPFFFLFLERTLRRPTVRNGVWTGLFYAMSALATWYYAAMLPIAAILYLACRQNWWSRDSHRLPLVKSGVAAALIAFLLVLPFAVPYVRAMKSGTMPQRPIEESQAFSASVADFVIPPIRHPVFGSWMQHHWRHGPNGAWLSEWELYLGAIVLPLAFLGILRGPDRRITFSLVVMAAGCFVLSLGPTYYFTHPASAPGSENLAPLSRIPLPVLALRNIPPFSQLRAWARMGFFVQVAVSLLAARGFAYLVGLVSPRHRIARSLLILSVLCLAAVDIMEVPRGMASVAPRQVDRWLAAHPEKFTIMEYPIPDHAYSGPAMYSTRLNGKRIVMGYASYPPNLQYFGTLSLFPAGETLDLLEGWDTKFVLVDENLYRSGSEFWQVRQTWNSLRREIAASDRLKEVTVLDGVHVYELLPVQSQFAGPELLGDVGFEDNAQTFHKAWTLIGKPLIDSSGKRAHLGRGTCGITSKDFLRSSPIPISPGQCYCLSVFHRDASRNPAKIRLQINWLDAQRRELDAATAAIRVVECEKFWQMASDDFRAPPDSRFAAVYAIAQNGRVWIDDYSLRQRAGGCYSTLEAIPNPVPVQPPPDQGRSAILWDTHGGSTGQVYLSVNGGPSTLFAQAAKGSKILDGIRSDFTYQFRLEDGKNNSIKTLTVESEAAVAIAATPVIFVPTSSLGKTVVSWNTFNNEPGEIYVSQDDAPEELFAQGPTGSAIAPWISAGKSYEFRLYVARDSRRLLAKVLVKGDEPAR